MTCSEIEGYVNILIDQPLRSIGRAANMLLIGFGENISRVDYQGNNEEVSRIALHVQCPWRMVDKENKLILFARSDIYEPNSTVEWTEDFNWDIQGINMFDEKAKIWIESNPGLYVKDLRINIFRDLRVFLSNDTVLDVYVDSSTEKECWRLFECESGKEKFVATGKRIFFEAAEKPWAE